MDVDLFPPFLDRVVLRYQTIRLDSAFPRFSQELQILIDVIYACFCYNTADEPRKIRIHGADRYNFQILHFLEPFDEQLGDKFIFKMKLIFYVYTLFCFSKHASIPRQYATVSVEFMPGAKGDNARISIAAVIRKRRLYFHTSYLTDVFCFRIYPPLMKMVDQIPHYRSFNHGVNVMPGVCICVS